MAALQKREPPKETINAVVPWEEELAQQAAAEAKNEAIGNDYFSFKGGTISFSGNGLGNKMNVVVAGAIYDRAYYLGAYGETKSPECYAYSKDGIGMVPHEKSPNKQHESCDTCPHNQFGSAQSGAGKACREYRKLALISAEDLTAEEVPEATIGLAKISPTNMKAYATYVRSAAEVHKRPVWALITEVTVMPDPKTQVKVSFKPVGELSQEVVGAIRARIPAVEDKLFAPYPVFTEAAPPPKPAKTAKFAVRK